jgi:hypothetical protein
MVLQNVPQGTELQVEIILERVTAKLLRFSQGSVVPVRLTNTGLWL